MKHFVLFYFLMVFGTQISAKTNPSLVKYNIEQQSKVEEYFMKGNSHYFNKEYDKAITVYQKAIKINPKKDKAYLSFENFKEDLNKFLIY